MRISRRQGLKLALTGIASLPLLPFLTRRAHAETHVVNIQNFAFSPQVLKVGVGDTVIFTNSDGAPHTATSLDDLFDTGEIASGGTAQITVQNEGGLEYICKFHPTMQAVIIAN